MPKGTQGAKPKGSGAACPLPRSALGAGWKPGELMRPRWGALYGGGGAAPKAWGNPAGVPRKQREIRRKENEKRAKCEILKNQGFTQRGADTSCVRGCGHQLCPGLSQILTALSNGWIINLSRIWTREYLNMTQMTAPPDKLGAPARNKPGHWVQTERKAHEAWANLIAKKPRAAMLLHHLVAQMGHQNAVVVSQKTLAKLMGIHERTVRRAVADLVEDRWIAVIRIGSGKEAAYVVNDRVAWGQPRDQLRLSVFSATVVADIEIKTRPRWPTPTCAASRPCTPASVNCRPAPVSHPASPFLKAWIQTYRRSAMPASIPRRANSWAAFLTPTSAWPP